MNMMRAEGESHNGGGEGGVEDIARTSEGDGRLVSRPSTAPTGFDLAGHADGMSCTKLPDLGYEDDDDDDDDGDGDGDGNDGGDGDHDEDDEGDDDDDNGDGGGEGIEDFARPRGRRGIWKEDREDGALGCTESSRKGVDTRGEGR